MVSRETAEVIIAQGRAVVFGRKVVKRIHVVQSFQQWVLSQRCTGAIADEMPRRKDVGLLWRRKGHQWPDPLMAASGWS